MTALPWPALDAARRHDPAARVPFFFDRGDAPISIGSVARAHLPTLRSDSPALRVADDRVDFVAPTVDPEAAWAALNQRLRHLGLIVGWRHELVEVHPVPDGVPPDARQGAAAPPLARIERAAARFWGTTTLGAHATGYLADAAGRPTHLWIARRSMDKATDPGRLDNLVGGGVPAGQSVAEALVREGDEEAGLDAATMARARPGGVLLLRRSIPEGLQLEWLYSHDLRLDPGERPCNRDGEVAELHLLPVPEALALAAAGEMTVDAELVTLDFALRHHLIEPADTAAALQRRLDALRYDTTMTPE